MDETKSYFLKHTELKCVDMPLWGQTEGQTEQYTEL